MPSLPRPLGLALLLAAAPLTHLLAQTTVTDAPPVDARTMLQALGKFSEDSASATKARKQSALQEATAAAGNPARATELWEAAVMAMQFQGEARDSTQFREWKTTEGPALKEREVQNALHLYFNWLALTLQRSLGASNHDLFSAVFAHAQLAMADQASMDAFSESLKKETETMKGQPGSGVKGRPNEHERKEVNTSGAARKLHDQIAGGSVGAGLYAQATKITELLSDLAPTKRGATAGDASDSWESSPSNVDGIYQQILLPEMRAHKDPRAIEYWDAKMRLEAEAATLGKLTSGIEKYNSTRRPQLLWSRAHEYGSLGLKNREETEMFAVIKGFPAHPDLPSWVLELTALLALPRAAAPVPVVTAEPLPGARP